MAGGRAKVGRLDAVGAAAVVSLGLFNAALSMDASMDGRPAACCCAGAGAWKGAGGTGSGSAAMLAVSSPGKSAMDIAIAWQHTCGASGELTSSCQAGAARNVGYLLQCVVVVLHVIRLEGGLFGLRAQPP
jgi:hypothetical protein